MGTARSPEPTEKTYRFIGFALPSKRRGQDRREILEERVLGRWEVTSERFRIAVETEWVTGMGVLGWLTFKREMV